LTAVLDSWAVIRHLEDAAPAAGVVGALLETQRPVISWINLGEVFYVVRRLHGEDHAAETVRDLREALEPELPTAERILAAARIKSDYPLAYADAFAAATAMAHQAELWTGDPELLLDGSPWLWRDLRLQG
jgi:predicted nucleic acid-binding protein